jgi:hypothetical protein
VSSISTFRRYAGLGGAALGVVAAGAAAGVLAVCGRPAMGGALPASFSGGFGLAVMNGIGVRLR